MDSESVIKSYNNYNFTASLSIHPSVAVSIKIALKHLWCSLLLLVRPVDRRNMNVKFRNINFSGYNRHTYLSETYHVISGKAVD